MKILILSGSNRDNRKSHRLALHLKAQLEQKGHQIRFFDVMEHPIPLLEDIYARLDQPGESLQIFKSYLDEVDHIIVVTPEYNGHFAPAVKNTLDHFKPEYSKKAIGVATASNGKMGGIRASMHMQAYVLALGGYPCPKIGMVPFVHQNMTEEGEVKDEQVSKTLQSFIEEFLWLAEAVSEKLRHEHE